MLYTEHTQNYPHSYLKMPLTTIDSKILFS